MLNIWKRTLIAIAVVVLPICSWGQSLSDGVTAHQNGDYETAFEIFLPLAKTGDPVSQAILGTMYYAGQGVQRDGNEGVRWYRLAAEQGDVYAQSQLAGMYLMGTDEVERDHATAAELFGKAARGGVPSAMFTLGIMYERGNGVPQDRLRARMWLDIASGNGSQRARKHLETFGDELSAVELLAVEKLTAICVRGYGELEAWSQEACDTP